MDLATRIKKQEQSRKIHKTALTHQGKIMSWRI